MHPHLTLACTALLAAGGAAQGVVEAPEPNDTPATAAVMQPGDQAYGALVADPVGDRDLFRFVLAARSDLRAWTAPGFSGPVGDTRLALCDDLGNVVVEVDDGAPTTHGYYSLLTVGGVEPGTWHLRVRGWDPSYVGSYTLDLIAAAPGTYVPDVTLSTVTEVMEPNDPREPGVATPSTTSSRNLGALTGGGVDGEGFAITGADYDFFSFVMTTTGIHVLSTEVTPTTAAAPPVDDTVLFLVDANLNLLAQNDDFGATTYSRITFDITTPGTYLAAVKGYYATSAGNYALDIIGPQPPLPDVASSVVVHPGGCPGSAGPVTLGVRGNSFGFTSVPEQPLLGSTFVLDVQGAPAGAALLRALGTAPASPPIDLGAAGAPGCTVEVAELIDIGFADAAGVHFWLHRTPMRVELLGLRLQQQVGALDAGNNALGVSLSNRVSTVLGSRH